MLGSDVKENAFSLPRTARIWMLSKILHRSGNLDDRESCRFTSVGHVQRDGEVNYSNSKQAGRGLSERLVGGWRRECHQDATWVAASPPWRLCEFPCVRSRCTRSRPCLRLCGCHLCSSAAGLSSYLSHMLFYPLPAISFPQTSRVMVLKKLEDSALAQSWIIFCVHRRVDLIT